MFLYHKNVFLIYFIDQVVFVIPVTWMMDIAFLTDDVRNESIIIIIILFPKEQKITIFC